MNTEYKKILGPVPKAENLIVTSDNRWFASGGDGFYQIDPDGATPLQIPIAFDASSAPSTDNKAFFCGITQFQHFLYATCSPELMKPDSPRYIMLMDLQQSPLTMVAIYQISSPMFFNGMASDMAGHLYLTNEGSLFPPQPGRIVKLNMASPTEVAGQSDWMMVNGHPNGLKIDGDMLYFSQEPIRIGEHRATVQKVGIKSDGTIAGTPETIYTAGGADRLLDDIELVKDGLLITQGGLWGHIAPEIFPDSPLNQIVHISESGQELHITDIQLAPPSAVKLFPNPARRSPCPDLIVTERTGDVIRLSPDWELKSRH